ncbi:unnamed protein product [Fusarium venenatum]|uniref:Uncharacterized protein n=1 Tax=Fusarium venenatum TaxID=56646 RepID=A0A2L2TFC7_9HYPO|nr:uncharacterized protein FVRRES_08746 [Fusarium venenatum]CEI68669.1 unnamed protein product [Fusarium venenatum]
MGQHMYVSGFKISIQAKPPWYSTAFHASSSDFASVAQAQIQQLVPLCKAEDLVFTRPTGEAKPPLAIVASVCGTRRHTTEKWFASTNYHTLLFINHHDPRLARGAQSPAQEEKWPTKRPNRGKGPWSLGILSKTHAITEGLR